MKLVLPIHVSASVLINGSESSEVFKKPLHLKVMENEKCLKGKW